MIRIANIVSDSANITIKDPEGLVYVDTLTFEEYKNSVSEDIKAIKSSMVTANEVNNAIATFLGIDAVEWVDELPADAADHPKIAYCILEG